MLALLSDKQSGGPDGSNSAYGLSLAGRHHRGTHTFLPDSLVSIRLLVCFWPTWPIDSLVCVNAIILVELLSAIEQPRLRFQHSPAARQRLGLFTGTLWIGEGSQVFAILHRERKQLFLIFGIISRCCRDCARVWQRMNRRIRTRVGG